MPAGRRQTKFERENNLQRIADFYLRGWRQVDIAAELKLTQPQIAYDLKIIQQRWRESSIVDMNEAKQRELARIDVLEREYWDAWERSQGERSKMRQTRRGEDQLLSVEKEMLVGNPAFLAGVQWCIAERSKILGLYAPIRNENRDLLMERSNATVRIVYGQSGDSNILASPSPWAIAGSEERQTV